MSRRCPLGYREMKPADYTGTIPHADLFLGQRVWVRAWWTTASDLTECEVVELWKTSKQYITVRPLTGNTHVRMVDIRTISH